MDLPGSVLEFPTKKFRLRFPQRHRQLVNFPVGLSYLYYMQRGSVELDPLRIGIW